MRVSLHYGISTLAGVLCCLAIVFALVGHDYRKRQRAKLAFKTLREQGAHFAGVSEKPGQSVVWTCVEFSHTWKGSDSHFRQLLELPNIEFIILDNSSIGPSAINHISKMDQLKEIAVYSTAQTPESVRILQKRLPSVRVEDKSQEIESNNRTVQNILREGAEFEFTNTSLSDVLEFVEDAYGVEIQTGSSDEVLEGYIKGVRVTFCCKSGSLESALRSLLQQFELELIVEERNLLITRRRGGQRRDGQRGH